MKVLFVFLCFMGYLLVARIAQRTVRNFGQSRNVADLRIKFVMRTVNLGIFSIFLILLCLSLGLGYGDVTLFVSSVFAVVGVALFAQWSILSNLTASIIIFFSFPYRVGDLVRIVEKDEDLTGIIEEIGMYHVLIRKANGDLITYPNSLILQKAVLKLARPDEIEQPGVAEPQDSNC